MGAWGYGVFRNLPSLVADLWSEVLDTLEWRGRFTHVVFAVPLAVRLRRFVTLSARSPPDPFTLP